MKAICRSRLEPPTRMVIDGDSSLARLDGDALEPRVTPASARLGDAWMGAVVVLGNRIVSTGYNGTPEGMTNCNQGGCYRCAHAELYESGKGYDVCICVHAEQNALLTAARFGISVEGSDVYTTLAPCFGCMKELLQAKVRSVYYLGDFKVDAEHRDQLDALIARFRNQKGRVKKLVVPGVDPNLGRSGPETIEDTGHTMPAA